MVDFLHAATNIATSISENLSVGSTFYAYQQQTLSTSQGLSVTYFQDYADLVARIFAVDSTVEHWYILQNKSTWVEIDPEQLWFWTKEWQLKESQVEEDLRQGRYEDFDDLDDLFDL